MNVADTVNRKLVEQGYPANGAAAIFIIAYIECAYFTDTGDGDQPPSDAEMSEDGIDSAIHDGIDFMRKSAMLLAEAANRVGYDYTRAGHDFWYTRNGHGVGFWCRDELDDGDLGNRLSDVTREFGQSDLYAGDDGLLYFGG
jgi:hypothetical protein